ncbi:hypothetical protein DER46DRAFT_566891 [Fusarium sp. MPI-SDFR-AT-0072]|nr:hypothetical protein DER46DRAFT_566891 [Fusarium sp. MPI-SDFR-AT-0072]
MAPAVFSLNLQYTLRVLALMATASARSPQSALKDLSTMAETALVLRQVAFLEADSTVKPVSLSSNLDAVLASRMRAVAVSPSPMPDTLQDLYSRTAFAPRVPRPNVPRPSSMKMGVASVPSLCHAPLTRNPPTATALETLLRLVLPVTQSKTGFTLMRSVRNRRSSPVQGIWTGPPMYLEVLD